MRKIILSFFIIASHLNAMELENPSVVQLTKRKVSNIEAAAGLISGKPMPIQYRFVFNMCSSLLQSHKFDYENIDCGDVMSGWSYYHQDGHQWENRLLETMFTYGMLNYYFQNAVNLTVDLNVDNGITKSDKDFVPWPGATLAHKQETHESLMNFLALNDEMPDEEKREAAWQAMKRLKFILDDYPRKLPVEIVKLGALYQRYKIVLEKYSELVEYNEYAKLMSLLDILQRCIIDFVANNKNTFRDFVSDTTKKIEYRNGFVVDHNIIWSSVDIPDDVKKLLDITDFANPFNFELGDQFNFNKGKPERQKRFIDEVSKRLSLFAIVE